MIAAIVHSPLTRLVPIGMMLLALQKTLFVELQPFGVIVQVVLAFVCAAGVAAGPELGAMTGFVMGLMFDLTVDSPLGSSSIAMGLAGYVAGWADVIRIETTWWLAAIFVAIGAAVGEAAVPVVRRFIGEEDVFVPELVTVVAVVAVAAALLSVLLVPLGRWSLRVEKPEWKVPTDG